MRQQLEKGAAVHAVRASVGLASSGQVVRERELLVSGLDTTRACIHALPDYSGQLRVRACVRVMKELNGGKRFASRKKKK